MRETQPQPQERPTLMTTAVPAQAAPSSSLAADPLRDTEADVGRPFAMLGDAGETCVDGVCEIPAG